MPDGPAQTNNARAQQRHRRGVARRLDRIEANVAEVPTIKEDLKEIRRAVAALLELQQGRAGLELRA